MSATTSHASQGDWLEYKRLIEYEYLVKNTSLKDLIILLRAQGLHATKGQLEVKLRNWNFSKNIDWETWQYVDRKIRKRKDEGKDSDIIHCGRRLKKLKVSKATNRHRETSIMARFKTPPVSPVNPQLSICTPPTYQMTFEWPSSLPWLRLQETTWGITIIASPSNGLTVHRRDQASIGLSLMMGVLVPQTGHNIPISLSKLITGISNVMPEWVPGEHTKTAQILFAGPSAEFLSEYFKVMVYLLSNSMVTHGQLDLYASLLKIGTINQQVGLKKLRTQSSSFRAFVERLFMLEIKEVTSRTKHNSETPKPLHLIMRLLELGQDPNCYCEVVLYHHPVLATPMQLATKAGSLELAELLLRFHACADPTQSRNPEEDFVNLALGSGCSDVRKLQLLNLLFDHKFLNTDEMLRAAIELDNEEMACRMLQCGPDITSYETSWLHPEIRQHWDATLRVPHFPKQSALMMAIQVGGRVAELMLDYLLIAGPPAPSILADAYIAAAYGGHHAILLRLDGMGSSGIVRNANGITPLHAAVVGNSSTMCRYLLERYGGVSSSLLLAAALLDRIDILQLLLDYGANPNTRICEHDIELCDFFGIFTPSYSGSALTIITTLIDWSDVLDSHEPSVLKLIQNGAILSNEDVAGLSELCFPACLKEALRAGGDPNGDDGYGRTSLQCAMAQRFSVGAEDQPHSSVLFNTGNDTDSCLILNNQDGVEARRLTVKLLIQAGAKMTGGEVVTAIRLRDKPLLLFLLQHGGTLTDIDDTGRGCLEAEIEARNDDSLQEALEMQESAIDAGPFCAAIQQMDWALVGRLFERAHQPTSCHLLEGTAVGLAAGAGQLAIVERLLARFTHQSVLSSAIVPIRLGRYKVEVSDDDSDLVGYWRATTYVKGETSYVKGSLLTLAAVGQDISGFRDLLRRGCHMDKRSWSAVTYHERSSDYVQLLREFDSLIGNSKRQDRHLNVALTHAIMSRNHEVSHYLVEVGADVNRSYVHAIGCPIELRLSPVQLATKKGDIDMAMYLLEKGGKVNAPPVFNQGATALQYASINGCIGFARHLLQLGARVNMRGSPKFGRSALEGAAEHGRIDMLALLVHHGAVTTGHGRQQLIRAIAYAQERGYQTAVEWLKENCGWTDADQDILDFTDMGSNYRFGECLWSSFCCDEYHDSDTQCFHHYTEEQGQHHYRTCKHCLKSKAGAGQGHGLDDGAESSSSSGDEDLDSEGNEH